ncbi:Hsp70 family protein [Enterobacter hormaechei]
MCSKCWPPAGIPRSAADDFDHLLADYIREQAGISDRSDARVQRELLDAAIDAKIALSDAQSVSVNVAGWRVRSPATGSAN